MTAATLEIGAVTRQKSVLVAHRAPLVAEALTRVVEVAGALRTASTTLTIADALRSAERQAPDLAICGLRFPDGLAPELCRALKTVAPRCTVVLFTSLNRAALLDACSAAGAYGVLQKDAPKPSLMGALVHLAGDTTRATPGHSALVPFEGKLELHDELTAREYEVLRLTSRGLTYKEIATELCLAPNTVRSYSQSVLTKFGARNKLQAIEQARRAGLI